MKQSNAVSTLHFTPTTQLTDQRQIPVLHTAANHSATNQSRVTAAANHNSPTSDKYQSYTRQPITALQTTHVSQLQPITAHWPATNTSPTQNSQSQRYKPVTCHSCSQSQATDQRQIPVLNTTANHNTTNQSCASAAANDSSTKLVRVIAAANHKARHCCIHSQWRISYHIISHRKISSTLLQTKTMHVLHKKLSKHHSNSQIRCQTVSCEV